MNEPDPRRAQLLLRQELLVPAEAMKTWSTLALEAARDPGLEVPKEFRAALTVVQRRSVLLVATVNEYIARLRGEDVSADDVDCEERVEAVRRAKHDLLNDIGQITGPCLVLEIEFGHEDADRFFGSFRDDLRHVCRNGDALVAALRDRGAPGSPQPTAVSLPDVDDAYRPNRGSGHILVADDSEENRRTLRAFLERDGFEVSVARDGREALAMLDAEDFDLLILDVVMPHVDGYEVLRRLRAESRTLPVIVVSGLDSTDDVANGIRLGADDFLARPVDPTLLRARVNACLEKLALRRREYAQFLPDALARRYVHRPQWLERSHDAELSILFCDVQGFSATSERLPPEAIMRWLGELMELLSACVLDEGGVLVDYIGDELVAMWGAPEAQPDHASRACRAALAMLDGLARFDEGWMNVTGTATRVGIGINSGVARVGNTGTQRRKKYGPLGAAVNLASRVQGATRFVGTDLLLTGSTRALLGEAERVRRLCKVRVKGIHEPVDLFTLDGNGGRNGLDALFDRALEAFESGDAPRAATLLGEYFTTSPADGPALRLMSRVVEVLLGENDGDHVWTLPGK